MTTEQQQLPDKGILQIDGKPVTAVTFKRHISQEQGVTYDLSASFGGKPVVKLKGLTMVEVDEAIGQKNADAIHRRTDGATQGTLRGDKLSFHNGTTEAGKAERERERISEDAKAKTEALSKEPEVEALAKRMGITAAELQRRLQLHETQQAEADKKAIGAVKRADVPMQEPAMSDEKRREVEQQRTQLRSEVEKQYLVREGRYYSKDKDTTLKIEDRGHKLVTPEVDQNLARNMAKLAMSKGWDSLKVSGHPDFKREVWIEATARGVQVKGYTATEADKAAMEVRRIAMSINEVRKDTPSKQPEQAADDKAKHQGNDQLAAQVGKAKARERADEDAKQRQHEADGRRSSKPRSERMQTIEAVAKVITESKVTNVETQKLVQREVAARLDKMQAKGVEPPAPRIYDKAAAAKQRGPELPRQQIERNTERTR